MAIHRYRIPASAALLALHAGGLCAGTIYRWVDQGQVHFSDHAPQGEMTASEIRQPDVSRSSDTGLRAAETELLQQIQQRAQLQQQQAQLRRLKISRERAEHQQRCNTNRKKLQASRGHDNYKLYSRYLRTHCW